MRPWWHLVEMDLRELMSSRVARGVLVGAAVVAVLAVIAPEIFTGTFSDAGTLGLVVALIAGIVAWIVLTSRLLDGVAVQPFVTWVPVAVIGALLLWPYVRPATEVDEAFPPVSAAPATTAAPTTAVPTSVPTTTVPPTTASTENGAAPATTAVPTTSTAAPATTAAPTTTEAPRTEPLELRRASFQGLTGHRGDGDAAVYLLTDDSILLRFEEVDIGSGPDLRVYLVPGDDRRDLDGGVLVADLTAERGNQNYTPPPDVDLTTGTWTVLVWCETFDLEVANATLT